MSVYPRLLRCTHFNVDPDHRFPITATSLRPSTGTAPELLNLATNNIKVSHDTIQIPHLPIPRLHREKHIQQRGRLALCRNLERNCRMVGARRQGTRDGSEILEDDLCDA